MSPIRELFGEGLVVCQEGDPEEIAISKRYGYRPVATEKNLGIQGGVARAIEIAAHDIVLFVENDWRYLNPASEIITNVFEAFRTCNLDLVKLFLPLNLPRKFTRYWHSRLPLRRKSLGVLRWKEANAYKAEAIRFVDTNSLCSDYLTPVSKELWLTDSRFIKWSNNPFIVKKRVFLDSILPFANQNPTAKLINGFPDLEVPINCVRNRWWWRKQQFRIGIVKDNLFTHERFDRPKGDEKWVVGTPLLKFDEKLHQECEAFT